MKRASVGVALSTMGLIHACTAAHVADSGFDARDGGPQDAWFAFIPCVVGSNTCPSGMACGASDDPGTEPRCVRICNGNIYDCPGGWYCEDYATAHCYRGCTAADTFGCSPEGICVNGRCENAAIFARCPDGFVCPTGMVCREDGADGGGVCVTVQQANCYGLCAPGYVCYQSRSGLTCIPPH